MHCGTETGGEERKGTWKGKNWARTRWNLSSAGWGIFNLCPPGSMPKQTGGFCCLKCKQTFDGAYSACDETIFQSEHVAKCSGWTAWTGSDKRMCAANDKHPSSEIFVSYASGHGKREHAILLFGFGRKTLKSDKDSHIMNMGSYLYVYSKIFQKNSSHFSGWSV